MAKKKRAVGRPSVDFAYKLRSVIWFHAVSIASGKNENELEVFFGGSKNQKYSSSHRPGLWRKYKTGRICPKFKPDYQGRPSIVERVEQYYPGTAKWMNLPFWEALTKKKFDMDDLRAIYLSLDPMFRDEILIDPTITSRMFWRRETDNEKLFLWLSTFDHIDAATALLALIREAEIMQNQRLHKLGLSCIADCINNLSEPILQPWMNGIRNGVERIFSEYEYNAEDGSLSYEALSPEVIRALWKGRELIKK